MPVQAILLAGVTQIPQPRFVVLGTYSLAKSPTKNLLTVPPVAVAVKLISICQLGRDDISGKSNVVFVGIVTAPLVA